MPFQRWNRRGVALVLVLAFISLLSALLIAFFSSTTNSRREAAQYEAGITVAQLAETAQNVVMGQISDATKTYVVPVSYDNTTPTGSRLTYATQPGMVRTYNDAGKAEKVFKLYSSGEMVETGDWVVSTNLATEVPPLWPNYPGVYVDLNQPALSPDASGPIIPPGTTQRYSANYPILDPSALATTTTAGSPSQDGVDGFDLATAPGYGGLVNGTRPVVRPDINPLTNVGAGKTGNPVPMPVQWIYVLQNGTLTSPVPPSPSAPLDASWSNLQATNANKPSKANPIVGRIAFWTDDDTCKLNPNVHSEGVAWGTAFASNSTPDPYGEVYMRDRQPVKSEWQRYAGHPATVCLSTVLGFIPQYRIPFSDTAPDYGVLTNIYNLVPRVTTGGSKGGTATTGNTTIQIEPVVQDFDRLYATADEMAFRPNRSVTSFINRSALEKIKFFITTSARSPEVNLFGGPRVSLWNLQQEKEPNAGKGGGPQRPRNATDELLAFCSTLGNPSFGNVYFFQRYSIYLREQVNDRSKHVNNAAYQLPAFGYVPPSSQSTTADWTIQRNTELYRYLQRLTSQPIPGFGGKITDMYPVPVRNQILTEMIDLMRLTNSYALSPQAPALRYEFAPARQMPDAVSGETQVVPLVPPGDSTTNDAAQPGAGTKGFGRFSTVTEAMLVFYRTPATPAQNGNPAHENMRVVMALEPFTPNAGSWTWSPLTRYVVTGMEGIKIEGVQVFPSKMVNYVTSRCGYGSGGNHNTAHTGTFANFRRWKGSGADQTKTFPTDAQVKAEIAGTALDEEVYYPFISIEVPVNPAAGDKKFLFTGNSNNNPVKIEIHTGYADHIGPDTLVQTINLQFPSGRLPIPTGAATADFATRVPGDPFNPVVTGDTVRSLEVDPKGPTMGDLRMVASARFVPSNYFLNSGLWESDTPIIHSFRNGDGGAITGGSCSTTLVGGLAADNYIAARGMSAALMSQNGPVGDWDNGPYNFMDGSYINKPDDYYGSSNAGDWYDCPTNTPNRQLSSGVVFGSLPVGSFLGGTPWRTLCFTPEPSAGSAHPALSGSFAATGSRVRDHLFLDFFTMPIVEPFSVSEPLSTMGKVNLNFQLAPFSYITRATAMHAVLKSTRMYMAPTHRSGIRYGIDPTETLKEFTQRFDDAQRGMFRSASEICDMHLVPRGSTLTAAKASLWTGFKGTGDNAREQPYGQIYARTTTKSNTFTVHMRVQTLRKNGTTDDYSVWHEDKDHVTGEYRGAATIERYVDLGNGAMPDFAKDDKATLDKYYKFRVVQVKRFNP